MVLSGIFLVLSYLREVSECMAASFICLTIHTHWHCNAGFMVGYTIDYPSRGLKVKILKRIV